MKIVFLCGSLEPGKDGVGDYIRRLGFELINNYHHEVVLIGLNDKFIIEENLCEQKYNDVLISVFRLPAAWPQWKRFNAVNQFISDFDPEWISLQFVPFSFHPKGLPYNFASNLSSLGRGKKWHIMIHELWVGMDIESSQKFKYWGWLQKQFIRSLFKKLNPTVVHSHTDLYRKMLQTINIKALHLPLFGNIQVATGALKSVEDELTNNNEKEVSFVLFGGIHTGVVLNGLLRELRLYSITNKQSIILKLVGRNGGEQSRWKNEWEGVGLKVEILGEKSEVILSELLSSCSFGISTTPSSLIEKSGSVAAMREHGLPVLCISRPWNAKGYIQTELPAGITIYREGVIYDFLNNKNKVVSLNSISDVANKFVTHLANS